MNKGRIMILNVRWLCSILVLLCLWGSSGWAQTTVVLPVTKDSCHDWRGWFSNYLGSYLYTSGYNGAKAYYYRDIVGALSQPGYELQINWAEICYYVYGSRFGSTPSFPYTVQAFRITQDYPNQWSEGPVINDDSSTYDRNTLPPVVQEGYGTYSGTQETGWFYLDVTSLVRKWVHGHDNFGVMVTNTSGYLPQGIFSREYNVDPDKRPHFTVNYTLVPIDRRTVEIPILKDSCYDWRGWFSNYVGNYLYTDPWTKSYFYADILSWLDKPGHQITINNAHLKYNVYGSRFGNTPTLPYEIQAYRISEDYPGLWSEGPVITDDPATRDTTTLPPTTAEGYGTCASSTEIGWFTLDITSLAQSWLDDTYDNYGVMVTNSSGYLPQGLYSRETSNADNYPVISIDYTVSRSPWENDLTRGHRLLIENGLQIQTMAFPNTYPTGESFSMSRFDESNFTTLNTYTYNMGSWLDSPPGIPWARMCYTTWPGTMELQPAELPYLPKMVSFQYQDENRFDLDPTLIDDMEAWFALNKLRYPDVINYDDQSGPFYNYDLMRTYITQAKPDLVAFNYHVFDGDNADCSPTRLYVALQRYRQSSLEGLDGYGAEPVPYGILTQTWPYEDHIPSETELRLNQFTSWAFGYKFICSYFYNKPEDFWNADSIFFTGNGDANPTAQFYQMAESNRQSLNLGTALVRLLSTDVRMKMGKHPGERTSWYEYYLDWEEDNTLPYGVSAWSTSADPYITGITVTNLGSHNTYVREKMFSSTTVKLPGDVVIGFFEPLHEDFDGSSYSNQEYFMIVNALSAQTGLCSEALQRIRIEFDFGSSGISSLQRMRRSDGQVETVNLVSDGGSRYHIDLELDGGTGDLFKYNTGAPFVGTAGQP